MDAVALTPSALRTSSPNAAERRASLADLRAGQSAIVRSVDGPRVFRRRMLELGILPGTEVRFVSVAPLGDPLQLEVRGCRLSIRRHEAAEVTVELPREKRHLEVRR